MIKKRSRRRGKKIRCEREKMWRRPTSSSTSKCPMSIQTLHRYLIKRFFPFGQIFRSDYDFSLMRCRKKCVILLSIFPSWAVHVTYISSVALYLTILLGSLHCTASHIHLLSLFILNYCCSLVALDLFGMNCVDTMYTKNPIHRPVCLYVYIPCT